MASFYKWHAKYGGMDISMRACLKEIEAENRQLKKMYVEEGFTPEIARDDNITDASLVVTLQLLGQWTIYAVG